MKKTIFVLAAATLLFNSCKKEPTIIKAHEPVAAVVSLEERNVKKFCALPVVKKYLTERQASFDSRVYSVGNGLRTQYTLSFSKHLKEEGQETKIVLLSTDPGTVMAIYEVKEHLYFSQKIGYDIKNLLDQDHLLREYAWIDNGGTFTPTVRSCGNGMGYADCVWDCFSSLFHDWTSGFACTFFPQLCATAAAIACCMIQTADPNTTDRLQLLDAMQQSLNEGKLTGFLEENGVFLIK